MNEEIELRHLRYFLAVADSLHFTRAAQQLKIAQPALSQQIRRLEELLGHALFLRTTRGVQLTPAGSLLALRARTTLARVEDDLAQVRRVGRGEEGTLSVGFSGSVMFTELPAAIRRFRKRYPKVELQLREMWTSAQVEALRDGALDLGFLRDGEGNEGLATRTLLRERFVAVLPERHALAAKRTLRVNDLDGEPFILFSRAMGPLAYDRTIACCEQAGFVPEIVQYAPQFPTLFRLVAAGIGVSLAPACMARLSVPGAVYREVRSTARSTVDLAMRAGFESPLADNFVALLRTQIGSEERP
ncbi:transcriptional regulator, LysR family [Bryocella elongata]|uniref:Transcriptional regulator, LysR family n=1 Tax=Bryocella elongata TaxID=863522 RepID=A0A1H6BPK6_9BACT|nr:LysR family transcriptional regulator [Bryocella elongata]SEG62562.1 transcriptional regulator, LysR family [Bryocella elongata]